MIFPSEVKSLFSHSSVTNERRNNTKLKILFLFAFFGDFLYIYFCSLKCFCCREDVK